MKKIITFISFALIALALPLSMASAYQAAPQSSDKAKEMMEKKAEKVMEKNADKGESAEAKMNAEQKKMEGQAKANAAKSKPRPPSRH